ncbi:Hypothetical protein D9617_14g077470 [Elsinoe fawcettii]|nr:Hypothetical protein D9617_14g077470 [Elsinoe fawcettii]
MVKTRRPKVEAKSKAIVLKGTAAPRISTHTGVSSDPSAGDLPTVLAHGGNFTVYSGIKRNRHVPSDDYIGHNGRQECKGYMRRRLKFKAEDSMGFFPVQQMIGPIVHRRYDLWQLNEILGPPGDFELKFEDHPVSILRTYLGPEDLKIAISMPYHRREFDAVLIDENEHPSRSFSYNIFTRYWKYSRVGRNVIYREVTHEVYQDSTVFPFLIFEEHFPVIHRSSNIERMDGVRADSLNWQSSPALPDDLIWSPTRGHVQNSVPRAIVKADQDTHRSLLDAAGPAAQESTNTFALWALYHSRPFMDSQAVKAALLKFNWSTKANMPYTDRLIDLGLEKVPLRTGPWARRLARDSQLKDHEYVQTDDFGSEHEVFAHLAQRAAKPGPEVDEPSVTETLTEPSNGKKPATRRATIDRKTSKKIALANNPSTKSSAIKKATPKRTTTKHTAAAKEPVGRITRSRSKMEQNKYLSA